MKRSAVLVLAAQLILMGSLNMLWARQEAPRQDTPSTQSPPAADNTKVNKRDRNSSEPTADSQKENPTDRQLAQQVRRALVKDKSLSTNARNIKVIAQNGMVTLKGPVDSDSEKQTVEAKAAQVAGSDKVNSQIEVRSK
jgi:hyperosmotically inducible periplasmic protein